MSDWKADLADQLSKIKWEPEALSIPDGIDFANPELSLLPPLRTPPLTVPVPGLEIGPGITLIGRINSAPFLGYQPGAVAIASAEWDAGGVRLAFVFRSLPWGHIIGQDGRWHATDEVTLEAIDFDRIGTDKP